MWSDVMSSSSMARWSAVYPMGYPGSGVRRSTPSAYTCSRVTYTTTVIELHFEAKIVVTKVVLHNEDGH